MARSTLAVMATGCGKTIVFGHVARDWRHGRVLILAHREELIFQAAQKVSAVCSEECGIEMADWRVNEVSSLKHRVVVSSVQTLNSRRAGRLRMEKFDPSEFGLVIIDEAHHATARTYRNVLDWFKGCRVLGVTATPDRADEEALGQIFDSVSYEYHILDAIKDGFLVPITQQFVHVEDLDLSGCRSDRTDLKDVDVARVMNQEGMLHKVVDPIVQLAGERPTLVFASSVEHAHRMAEIFNRHKPGKAAAIDGNTEKVVRRDLLKSFSRGEFQYIVNMGVFLEGFDEPRVACVAMARPTKSRALYAQVAGRGTRPLAGIVDGLASPELRREAIAASEKPAMLMLDFVGQSGRHKLVCTADILGGNESDEVIERATANAKKKAKAGWVTNTAEELEQARLELEEELRRRHEAESAARVRREALVAKAKFSTRAIDPFNILDIVPKREPGWHKGRRPTDGQRRALERFKVDRETIDRMSFSQAGQMLDVLVRRAEQKLCTLKQAKLLARYGHGVDVSFEQASKIIDAIARNGWKPLPG